MWGKNLSEEAKLKIIKANTGRKLSKQTNKRILMRNKVD